MLVFPDGTQAGTLGGGCVEAEVKRRALRGLNDTGRPEVLTFCLDDDYGWDDGLICGGRMTILAQPLTADGPILDLAARYYRHLHELADRGAGCTEAVVIGDALGLPVGDRYLFDADRRAGRAARATGPAWEAVSTHLAPLVDAPQAGDAARRRLPAGAAADHAADRRRRARRAGGRAARGRGRVSTSGCSTTATATSAPSASRPRAGGSSATSARRSASSSRR